MEPDSLSVTGDVGFPVWTLAAGAGVPELDEPELELELEPPHAATSSAIPRPSAARGPPGFRKEDLFLLRGVHGGRPPEGRNLVANTKIETSKWWWGRTPPARDHPGRAQTCATSPAM